MNSVTIERNTKETQITMTISAGERLDTGKAPEISIKTGLPFMDHMLHAFAFHGDWNLNVKASGDIEVDPHHLVEDLGIVLGEAVRKLYTAIPAIRRYGSMVLPMDDALCEAVIDLCNRPYLVYQTHWPQAFVGQLDVSLFREFFQAFVSNARCNLHLHCRWGENSHHIIEAIFKAFGIALNQAAKAQKGSQAMSTKGSL